MQHKQQNYKVWVLGALLAAAECFAVQSATSAGIADQTKSDSMLQGGPMGPCDPHTAGADLVGGTDVNGQPVAGADLEGPAVPVPGAIDVPLKARRGKAPAYVRADGKSLAPLLNPPLGCPAR
jgi:hypothetical protein